MKFTFKPSPNYRNTKSTTGIMFDLCLCLCVVLCGSAIYYGINFGLEIGLRVVLMAVFAVAAAVLTEFVYYKAMKAKDVKQAILHSYGWITALILVCITRIDVSYYAVIISTIIAILFGKLVFGGFGQNIFNPAAFGEAIIMNAFAASNSASVTGKVFDAVSGATPMTTANGFGWVLQNGVFEKPGFINMLLGNYTSVIGGSCALLILLCLAFLIWRKDICWRTTASYLCAIFVISLIVGFVQGTGLSFALFNTLGGGVLFGAVFMLTDPVTSPLSIPGRIVYSVGAAALTLILRWRANLPDGVLFSILLMNMLVPAIDQFMDGNQIKDASKLRNKVLITSVIAGLIAVLCGATAQAKEPVVVENTSSEAVEAVALNQEDLSERKASCDGEVCTALGFGGAENKATIVVKDGKVESFEAEKTGDYGDEMGDDAYDKTDRYVGATLDTIIDNVTGATETSKSFRAMVKAALEAAGK
ncbi:MAG: RnfABCDGE type electron transport complex subunit D [Solobacterium sp.]|nr:RnfABCDGE type electron transport complex subunit D [Solobacterium sp.]